MASSARKVGFLLRGWNEIPEFVGSGVMALIGFGLGLSALWLNQEKEAWNRKYKMHYTVIRPDDPRVAKIKKHSGLDD